MSILRSLVANVFPLFYEEALVARVVVPPQFPGGATVPGDGPGVKGSQWSAHFNAPGIVTASPAVLFFGVNPRNAQARISVAVNLHLSGKTLVEHTFTTGDFRSLHLLIPPNTLTPTGNEILFDTLDGHTVAFSDVAVLYMSNQLTVTKEQQVIANQ